MKFGRRDWSASVCVTCVTDHNLSPSPMTAEIFNPNPVVFSTSKSSARKLDASFHSLWMDDTNQFDDERDEAEPIDQNEIFGTVIASPTVLTNRETDLIRSIYDPEHPNTLEELRVVSAPQVSIETNHVTVQFTPTVPHCGASTLIGAHILLFF